MKKDIQKQLLNPEELNANLDEIVRTGAHQMIRMALEAEIQSFLDYKGSEKLKDGRPAFVRNGFHSERNITVGAGVVPVSVPRTRNRGTSGNNFISGIVPPYMRRSLKIDEAIPLLYLRGLSTGDIYPCLQKLLGEGIRGVSSASVSRLKNSWHKEYLKWRRRDLEHKEYCYIWVDGIHFNVRLGDNNLCVLVIMGALKNGHKELIAVEAGYRESRDSWAVLLRDLKKRNLRYVKLFIGDGALGFWKAVRDVYPEVRCQRCWVHKTANILDKLPKSVQPKAKTMIHEIYRAENKKAALKAFASFVSIFKAKYPRAAECLEKDKDKLLTFYDFPAEHWKHIRSTNAIESTFSTVRLRTRKTRGQGTEITTLLMVYKLMEMASLRWKRLAGRNFIPMVLKGVKFVDGILHRKAA